MAQTKKVISFKFEENQWIRVDVTMAKNIDTEEFFPVDKKETPMPNITKEQLLQGLESDKTVISSRAFQQVQELDILKSDISKIEAVSDGVKE